MMFSKFTILFTFLSFSILAQLNIGSIEIPNARSGAGALSTSDIRKIQRGNTVFFYGEKDTAQLEAFKKIAEEYWEIGTLKFDDIANFKNYERVRNTAFITLEAKPVYEVNTNIGKKIEVDCQFYYHFWMPGSREKISFARYDLYANQKLKPSIIALEKEPQKVDYFYKKGKAYNWNPTYARLLFSQLSYYINNEKTLAIYEDFQRTEEPTLSDLKNNTLYIPRNALMTKDLKTDEIVYQTAFDLFAKYEYNYEVLESDALEEKLNGEEKIYFLNYVLSGEDLHYAIYDNKGQIYYHRYIGNSVGLRPNHLKALSKLID